MMEFIINLQDYLGVIAGFIVLMLSSLLLPAKIRKYVLTAGLAILVFRTLQIANARKEMQAADAERKRLRELDEKLGEKLSELQADAEKLQAEKQDIEHELTQLQEESSALSADTADIRERKAKLDAKTQSLIKKAKNTQAKKEAQDTALNRAAELSRQYSKDWLSEGAQ